MSAIEKFLFDAGMEGFNDPSSIPSPGIVVPFFGVEEFAEADEESRVIMRDMNQQADAIYKLQETLVYINANRPNFDRGNAEHVVQALGDVRVLMPNMEDPVTIMGSLEHYTPAYTGHLINHGLESITTTIIAMIKKLIEMLKKGIGWLNKLIKSKTVVFGKQQRDLKELNTWLKTRKTTVNTTVGLAVNNDVPRTVNVAAMSYLFVPRVRGFAKPDQLATDITQYSRFVTSVYQDFIKPMVILGGLYCRALEKADFAKSNTQLYVEAFKGQPKFSIAGTRMKQVDKNGDNITVMAVSGIGGLGVRCTVPSVLWSPVEMSSDGKNQREYFGKLGQIRNMSFMSKLDIETYDLTNPHAALVACNEEQAERIVSALDMLTTNLMNTPYDKDVMAFSEDVYKVLDKFSHISQDADGDFIGRMMSALMGMVDGLSNLSAGMMRESNTLINNAREYVTKSVKA